MDIDNWGAGLLFGLIGLFLIWYFVGAALTRRQLAAAATWVNRGLQLHQESSPESRASIKWLSTNAFSILIEDPRPPLEGVAATVLLRSRDMVTVWLVDRLTGRQDLLLLRYELRQQPIWGVELFRRRSILTGDAQRSAQQERWRVEPYEEAELMVAHGGGRAAELCRDLLEALGPTRRRLVRLAVRRQAPHLTLAIDLPDLAREDPATTIRLGERLMQVALRYATS